MLPESNGKLELPETYQVAMTTIAVVGGGKSGIFASQVVSRGKASPTQTVDGATLIQLSAASIAKVYAEALRTVNDQCDGPEDVEEVLGFLADCLAACGLRVGLVAVKGAE